MEPNNTTDRKKAFSRFLLYYLVSIVLVIIIMFFGMKVPAQENDQLKSKNAVLEKDKAFAGSFLNHVTTIQHLLDSADRPGLSGSTEMMEGEAGNALAQLKESLKSEGTADENYAKIVAMLYDYKNAKKQLRDAGAKNASTSETRLELETVKKNLLDCQTQNADLLIKLRTPGNQ